MYDSLVCLGVNRELPTNARKTRVELAELLEARSAVILAGLLGRYTNDTWSEDCDEYVFAMAENRS